MTTMSTWLGVQGIELYGGTKDEFDDVKKQLQVRLKPVTPEDWRQGVFKTLRCLYTAPCLTSVPILQAVNGASLRGNKVTIKPTGPGDEKSLPASRTRVTPAGTVLEILRLFRKTTTIQTEVFLLILPTRCCCTSSYTRCVLSEG
jgi:hypothetical protein